MVDMPVAAPVKKTGSPFSRGPQLSIAHKLGVGSHEPFQFRGRMLTALVLWWSQKLSTAGVNLFSSYAL